MSGAKFIEATSTQQQPAGEIGFYQGEIAVFCYRVPRGVAPASASPQPHIPCAREKLLRTM